MYQPLQQETEGISLVSIKYVSASPQSKLQRTYAIFPFECSAEMALVVITQPDAKISNRQVCIQKILRSHFHTIVEEILEYGSAKLLLEGFLERTFVGTHHRG